MSALILSTDGFEDSELLVPLYRLREEGAAVTVASLERGTIRGEHGYEIEATKALEEIDPGDYDLLMLPGGKAPAALRRDDAALDIVRSFFAEGKPVAAICHGAELLVAAGVLRGRRATCFPTLAKALHEAGASYENEEVVVDANLVTSRRPDDLPALMREMLRLLRDYQRRTRSAATSGVSK